MHTKNPLPANAEQLPIILTWFGMKIETFYSVKSIIKSVVILDHHLALAISTSWLEKGGHLQYTSGLIEKGYQFKLEFMYYMRISCFLHASIMNQDTMGWKRFWKSNLDILNVLRFKYESDFIRYIEHSPLKRKVIVSERNHLGS